jgi:hypothetical protein
VTPSPERSSLFATGRALDFSEGRIGRAKVSGEAAWSRVCFGPSAATPAERAMLVATLRPALDRRAPAARRAHFAAVARALKLDEPDVGRIAARLLLASAPACGPVREAIALALGRPTVPAWVRAYGAVHPLWAAAGAGVPGVCTLWPEPRRSVRRRNEPEPAPRTRRDTTSSSVVIVLDACLLHRDPEAFATTVAHEVAHAALERRGVAASDLLAEAAALVWGFPTARPERYLDPVAAPDAVAARR